jgi:hypothetical protein
MRLGRSLSGGMSLRIRYPLLAILLAFPIAGYSQTVLNFPRSFTATDLSSTGFAVVNPGTTSAPVTFTLYNASGGVVTTSAQTIPAAGQLALLGTQLFPTVTQPGWVQLTSATPGLQGFWVGGDFATFTDGADTAPTSNDLIFPLVTTNTELNIANTAVSSNSVTIRIFGEAGTELATAVTRSIAPNGVLQSQASALFPTANLNTARYIRVTGATGLAGTAVISGFLVNEWGVTNAVSAAAAGTEANFPHVVSGVGGGGNYTTVVGVENLSSSAQTITLTFTPESGGAPITVMPTIPANGSLRDTAQNLFSFPAVFENGWVRVSGSAPLTAFVAYADSVANGFAVVPVQTTPRTTLMFAHIADLPPWLTGLALLNTTTSNATVRVYAMNPSGTLIGGADNVPTAQFTLNAGTKTAKLLSELVPQTQQRVSDGGFIFISSTQPLYGIELFFSRNLRILANVAAGSGTGFTPPTPTVSGPPVLTSVSPGRVAIGTTLTLAGSGFDSAAANDAIIFTGASGGVPAAAASATSNSLTVLVPPGAITGPVAVQSAGQMSGTQLLEVVATSTSLLPASVVVVTANATTNGADIYVPFPAGTLNATMIGVGDPGTSISLSSSSPDITRGQTKQIVLGGTGMSLANGTTVSISGTGISIGSLTFQGTFAAVTVTVSPSAAPGPRNVIVTNSNLDTSVLSGGLFIR